MPKSRVCFVVTELLGLVRNGGIATATTHAALVLSKEGYEIDLFYCGHQSEMEEAWAKCYVQAGITVRWLDRAQAAHPAFVADSYRLFHQLKDRGYDVIVFQDWQGLGYCSMIAKRAGLAFESTRLVHIVHGPDAWLREANRQLSVDGHELGSAHLERRSAELADAIVGPSQHLIDWMLEAGWNLAPDRHVIPYFTEGHTVDLDANPDGAGETASPLTELVFFGRLEERKGVRVFAEALNLLGPDLLTGIGITFLGRAATITPDQARDLIDPTVREQSAGVTFHGSFDQGQARNYLRQPGRLALIPSYLDNSPNVVYECIEDRVSFLASSSGGTGELVADDDKASALFEPTPQSMADALRPLLSSRRKPPPPRPSFNGQTSMAAWRPLLEPPAPAPAIEFGADAPLVSVVVPHFNQPKLIWDTVRSIAAQDYPHLEIVIVDDGSTDDAAIANLADLEAHDWGRPLQVIRQENQYLGAARNKGARHAAGDLIAYVDDDDLVEPEYVRALVTALTSFDADAVSIAIHGIEAADDGTIPADPENAVWVFLGDATDLATMFNVVGGAAALYRKQALDEVNGFFTHRGIGHEDWDLLVRLGLSGKRVVSLPLPLYKYRVRPKSMLRTTSTWANMQPVFESYRSHLPAVLRTWPELTRGQQDIIDELRTRLAHVEYERDQLGAALDSRERYLAVLRKAIPARARNGIRNILAR